MLLNQVQSPTGKTVKTGSKSDVCRNAKQYRFAWQASEKLWCLLSTKRYRYYPTILRPKDNLCFFGLQEVTGEIDKPGTLSDVCWLAEGYR